MPEIDENGFMKDDYLLITKLPNPKIKNRSMVVISGPHGLGTRSFEKLLENESALREASRKLNDRDDYFQSLFRIGGIKHDHNHRVTSFKAIEHLDTDILKIS